MSENKSSHSHNQDGADSAANRSGSASNGNSDDSWESLLTEHEDELSSVEHSLTAHRFEHHAEKQEKKEAKRLLNASDLRRDAFVSPRSRIGNGLGTGPRDFETSFLDIDSPGGSFVPSDGELGSVRLSTLVFTILTIVGLLLVALSLFLPIATILSAIGGLLLLVGAVGLFSNLRGHKETRKDSDDDGARR